MQTPSVGRIVHYVDYTNEVHVAAIVTQVLDEDAGSVCLYVFPSNGGSHRAAGAQYDARMSPGTWHYPEIVNTVSYHESEDEEEKREGPIVNSLEIEERDYPDPEKNDDNDVVLDGDGRDSVNIPASLRHEFES